MTVSAVATCPSALSVVNARNGSWNHIRKYESPLDNLLQLLYDELLHFACILQRIPRDIANAGFHRDFLQGSGVTIIVQEREEYLILQTHNHCNTYHSIAN